MRILSSPRTTRPPRPPSSTLVVRLEYHRPGTLASRHPISLPPSPPPSLPPLLPGRRRGKRRRAAHREGGRQGGGGTQSFLPLARGSPRPQASSLALARIPGAITRPLPAATGTHVALLPRSRCFQGPSRPVRVVSFGAWISFMFSIGPLLRGRGLA